MAKFCSDFNEILTHHSSRKYDNDSVEEIKSRLLKSLPDVLSHLLPAGVMKGDNFTVGDVYGTKGDSLIVALKGNKAGQWHDFATGEGGDILTLWARVNGWETRRDFPEVIKDIQEWLGISPINNTKSVEPKRKDLGLVTGKWDYLDTKGNLIACVYRYDPPSGKQYRPWDKKKGCYGLPNPRPLYNQLGLKSADTVILVEGEKAAQALIDAGFCATTAMGGANAPLEKTDWSPLKNKHVVIWPDKDSPGLTYAQKVSEHLKTCNLASLVILKPPRDKPEKWDSADAIAEGIDIQSFIASATPVSVTLKTTVPAYRVGYYLDDSSPMPSDIIGPRLLTPGGLLVLGGAPKVGKSDLLICWLAHLAAGIPFLGMTPPKPLKIFYLQTEIGYHYLRERLKNLKIDSSLMPLLCQNLVITPQIRMLLDERGVGKVAETIFNFFDQTTVDLIVIDPLCNVYDGGKTAANENDNSAMLAFLQDRVEALRHHVNPESGVMLVHHTKKLDKKSIGDDPFQAFSGASAIRRFYTAGIIMFRPDETQSSRKLIFEVRNGPSIPTKIIDKISNEWCEIQHESERLLKKEYGQKLDAERRRREDVILQMLFDEARAGTCYTPTQFSQRFENSAGLGGKNAIRERIDVLASKGYIKFNKESVAKSKYGIMCVEEMEMPRDGAMKPILATHFKDAGTGAVLPVENPLVWVYM